MTYLDCAERHPLQPAADARHRRRRGAHVAFRIREPRVMLACWRTLLVVTSFCPLCQPWLTSDVPIAEPSIFLKGISSGPSFSCRCAATSPWSITPLS